MTRRFTGRHMAIVLTSFFGTVIAVNITMATLASRTFGGTVVDNSYVASQHFNTWLARARTQDMLGWHMAITQDAGRRTLVAVSAGSGPLSGATVTATARHPLGRMADIELGFSEISPGEYRAKAALPAGRWYVAATVKRGSDEMHALEDVR